MKLTGRRLIPAVLLILLSGGNTSAESYDVILLQDESLTMKTTDPLNLRREASAFLIDQLKLSDPDNRMAIVLFGSSPFRTSELTRDLGALKRIAWTPLLPDTITHCYDTSDDVGDRDYTDFLLAMRRAMRTLESNAPTEEQSKRKRIVIILTDGMMDPWPGDGRFGKLSAQFLEELSHVPCFKRRRLVLGRSFVKYRRAAAKIDSIQIENEILSEFRRRGWKIYCIGFSNSVDRRFLYSLSVSTGGEVGIATDVSQLSTILSKTIPDPFNVIVLASKKFCDEQHEKFNVRVDGSIKKLQIIVSLSAMLQRYKKLPLRNNIRMSITDPSGRKYMTDSTPDKFSWYANERGQVHRISFITEGQPATGDWRITLDGIGSKLCGELLIKGKRDQTPKIIVEPDVDCYPENSSVQVTFRLTEKGGRKIPLSKVEASLQTAGGKAEERPINLPPPLNNEVLTNLSLGETPGLYRIKAKFYDAVYKSSPIHAERLIKVGCTYSLSVKPKRLSLGVISYDHRKAEGELRIQCTPPKALELHVIAPILKSGESRIPVHWFEFPPTIRTDENGLGVLRMSCRMSDRFPDDMVQGKYSGQMSISSPATVKPIRVDVELQVKLPEIYIQPEELIYNFRWMVLRPLKKRIRIRTNVKKPISVRIRYPYAYLFNEDETVEDRIKIRPIHSTKVREKEEGMVVLRVSRANPAEVTFEAFVDDSALVHTPDLNDEATINSGYYTGKINLLPSIGAGKRISIEAAIPEKPLILLYRRYGIIPVILAGIVALYLFATTISLRKRGLLRGQELHVPINSSIAITYPGSVELAFSAGKDDERLLCEVRSGVAELPTGKAIQGKIMIKPDEQIRVPKTGGEMDVYAVSYEQWDEDGAALIVEESAKGSFSSRILFALLFGAAPFALFLYLVYLSIHKI